MSNPLAYRERKFAKPRKRHKNAIRGVSQPSDGPCVKHSIGASDRYIAAKTLEYPEMAMAYKNSPESIFYCPTCKWIFRR